MKPKHLIHLIPLFLLPALAALGSCISPQDEPGDCQDCDLQQIALQVQENGGTSTRAAGRPLYSNEHAQMVDHVALYICYYGNDDVAQADNQIAAIKYIDDWTGESDTYANGRRDYFTLVGENRVPADATYKIYAIGYTYRSGNETEYTVASEGETKAQSLEKYLKGLKKDDTFPENLVLGLSDAAGEEIFAGTNTEDGGLISPNDVGGFATTVVLHRQVAGVYVYVEDIPQRDKAKTLRLTAACDNDGLVLGAFDTEDYGQNSASGENVVNGTAPKSGIDNATRSTICSIYLDQWKDATGGWKNPYDADNRNPAFVEGAYFVGSFVIPFAAPTQTTGSTDEPHSLQLELYGDDDTKPLQTWPVLLSGKDPQAGTFTRCTWDEENSRFTSEKVTETREAYSLLRNHLYCIGSKDADGNTDKDDPLPLSDANEITLETIAEWDVIYDMVLEPER